MNATLEKSAIKGPRMGVMRTVESPECPCCDSAIPRRNVERRFPEVGALEETEREILAWCGFCQKLFCERQILQGGNWVTIESTIVKDARKRGAFLKRLAEVSGDRRIEPVKEEHSAE